MQSGEKGNLNSMPSGDPNCVFLGLCLRYEFEATFSSRQRPEK